MYQNLYERCFCMKKTVAVILASIVLLATSGCSKQFMYDHIVVDINGHYVYFESAGHDWMSNTEGTKVIEIDGNTLAFTNMITYKSEPDEKCYEYTADEFAEHVCGPDADWRCPHSGHDAIE